MSPISCVLVHAGFSFKSSCLSHRKIHVLHDIMHIIMSSRGPRWTSSISLLVWTLSCYSGGDLFSVSAGSENSPKWHKSLSAPWRVEQVSIRLNWWLPIGGWSGCNIHLPHGQKPLEVCPLQQFSPAASSLPRCCYHNQLYLGIIANTSGQGTAEYQSSLQCPQLLLCF